MRHADRERAPRWPGWGAHRKGCSRGSWGRGNLKAAVDIELVGLTIRGLRLIEDGKGPWVAWPREGYGR